MSLIFFLIIELYFLMNEFTAQIFIPTAELATPAGIPTREAKAETEKQSLTVEEAKTSKFFV